jgi:regulation of enolase protein 1 (concanavalin A-like superfamily)
VQGGGNSGLYVWNMYQQTCSSIFVRGNIVWAQTMSGSPNSYWNGGGCSNVQNSGNRGDQDAKNALTAPGGLPPTPLIPPGPVACVAVSPWTNQTSKPRCDGGSTPIPPDPIPPNSSIVSDNFDAALSPWIFIGPPGASYALSGTHAQLTVPGGSIHPAWDAGVNKSARLVQRVSDGDFSITAKFDSVPARNMEIEGLIVEQDSRNFLRFELRSDGAALTMSAETTVDGAGTNYRAVTVAKGTAVWMRIQRRGSSWTLAASRDGSAYTSAAAFTHTMVVRQVGVYAANYGPTPAQAPAFSALVDSFVSQ